MPVVGVTCSDDPPRIPSHFQLSFGQCRNVAFDLDGLVRVTRIKRDTSAEVPFRGAISMQCRPAPMSSSPAGVEGDMRLVFAPSRTEKDGLHVGDVVSIVLDERCVSDASGLHPVSRLPGKKQITISQPAVQLLLEFDRQPANTSFHLSFDGLAQQPLKHLIVLIAARAHFLSQDIVKLSRKGGELRSPFELAKLQDRHSASQLVRFALISPSSTEPNIHTQSTEEAIDDSDVASVAFDDASHPLQIQPLSRRLTCEPHCHPPQSRSIAPYP